MLKHTSQEVSLLWVSHWKFRLHFHDCFKPIEICAAARGPVQPCRCAASLTACATEGNQGMDSAFFPFFF